MMFATGLNIDCYCNSTTDDSINTHGPTFRFGRTMIATCTDTTSTSNVSHDPNLKVKKLYRKHAIQVILHARIQCEAVIT